MQTWHTYSWCSYHGFDLDSHLHRRWYIFTTATLVSMATSSPPTASWMGGGLWKCLTSCQQALLSSAQQWRGVQLLKNLQTAPSQILMVSDHLQLMCCIKVFMLHMQISVLGLRVCCVQCESVKHECCGYRATPCLCPHSPKCLKV